MNTWREKIQRAKESRTIYQIVYGGGQTAYVKGLSAARQYAKAQEGIGRIAHLYMPLPKGKRKEIAF